jgi:hypothetical protein
MSMIMSPDRTSSHWCFGFALRHFVVRNSRVYVSQHVNVKDQICVPMFDYSKIYVSLFGSIEARSATATATTILLLQYITGSHASHHPARRQTRLRRSSVGSTLLSDNRPRLKVSLPPASCIPKIARFTTVSIC